MIKITSAQYQIEALPNWESYVSKVENLVVKAKKEGAHLLLLPEYAGIEAVCKRFPTDFELFNALQSIIPQYINLYQHLARSYQIYIQAGTIVEKISANLFVNRAYLFGPAGLYDYQDKIQLTEFEKKSMHLTHGAQQKVFETHLANIGIAICYDSEFPEIVRHLVNAQASIILVPSYTTTLSGFNRVFLSARARALENQCYVAISYVVNKVDLSAEEVDETFGKAAIVGPIDSGFPEDGILAEGPMGLPELVTASLSLEALNNVREDGQVHNFEDYNSFSQMKKDPIKKVRV